MLSKNTGDTFKIAKMFFDRILKNSTKNNNALVVGLNGDLGSGKTAFTKAVAKQLNIKNKVNSPTFVIIKKYPIKNKKHKFLFHIDAYRLKEEKELLHLGWEEIVNNKDNLVFIEWPENVSKIIPKNAKFIDISHTKEGYRDFRLK